MQFEWAFLDSLFQLQIQLVQSCCYVYMYACIMLAWMDRCMYVCCMLMDTNVCMHVCTCVRTYVLTYGCTDAWTRACMWVKIHVCTHACMHAYMQVHVHACMEAIMYGSNHIAARGCAICVCIIQERIRACRHVYIIAHLSIDLLLLMDWEGAYHYTGTRRSPLQVPLR